MKPSEFTHRDHGAATVRATCTTPVGVITLTQTGGAISALDWEVERAVASQGSTPLLALAIEELHAYFRGELTQFSLPLAPRVSDFTMRVLTAMQRIPFGETRAYGALASALNTAPRAVGGACGRNPIPIIIPCHRVLASGHMGGYSGHGGLETKKALLRHEASILTS